MLENDLAFKILVVFTGFASTALTCVALFGF
jgi:hypothetical protein